MSYSNFVIKLVDVLIYPDNVWNKLERQACDKSCKAVFPLARLLKRHSLDIKKSTNFSKRRFFPFESLNNDSAICYKIRHISLRTCDLVSNIWACKGNLRALSKSSNELTWKAPWADLEEFIISPLGVLLYSLAIIVSMISGISWIF